MDMIHQDGAREYFDATARLVAPGEVILLQNPMAASLLTGVTGRWTSSGILRDVQSAEGRATPEECHFYATFGGGGFMGGGPGPGGFGDQRRGGGFGSSGAPAGFEQVFENSMGSLWKNPATLPRLEPAKAAVSLAGLVVLAGLGMLCIALDLLLPRAARRARLGIAVAAFAAVAAFVAPLAATAMGELMHPPEAPARGPDMPFGGPPPGFAPGGPMPGFGPGGPMAPMGPTALPAELQQRYDRIQQSIFIHLGMGGDPRTFWAPEDEMEFRELVGGGKIAEAGVFLDRAIERLDRAEGAEQKNPPTQEQGRGERDGEK
jgi:hypothetical protein